MLAGLSNALLIYNPTAGNGGTRHLRDLDSARRILASAGIHTDLSETRGPGDAAEIARVAGAGPDGVMVYSLDLDLKARIGILAYWWEGVRQLFRYNFSRFRVVTPDKQLEATLIIIGRTKHYGGPFRITTEADLLEDRFELAALTTQSGLRYLSYLPTLWLGNLRAQDDVHFWKSDALVCEPLNERAVYAQVDGEPLGRLPVEFRIVPRGITLVIPRLDAAQAAVTSA